jgi:NAD(P)H-dependent FMN reductase
MYTLFVASLNENVKLAKILETQLKELNVKNTMINLVELNLPMYSSKEEEKGIPKAIDELVQTLENSKGYIVIAPEYNYSIPPVLTNAVAWMSRIDPEFKKYFEQKSVLLATHSGGGGADVLRDMRNQFTKLGANVLEEEILTTYKKPLDETYSKQVLQTLLALAK